MYNMFYNPSKGESPIQLPDGGCIDVERFYSILVEQISERDFELLLQTWKDQRQYYQPIEQG